MLRVISAIRNHFLMTSKDHFRKNYFQHKLCFCTEKYVLAFVAASTAGIGLLKHLSGYWHLRISFLPITIQGVCWWAHNFKQVMPAGFNLLLMHTLEFPGLHWGAVCQSLSTAVDTGGLAGAGTAVDDSLFHFPMSPFKCCHFLLHPFILPYLTVTKLCTGSWWKIFAGKQVTFIEGI